MNDPDPTRSLSERLDGIERQLDRLEEVAEAERRARSEREWLSAGIIGLVISSILWPFE